MNLRHGASPQATGHRDASVHWEGAHFALKAMTTQHLPAVMAVEEQAYEFPWTLGNVTDSLASGYEARVLESASGTLCAYFIAMMGVDEMHLLNFTVAPAFQGQGHGRRLLGAVNDTAYALGAEMLWLEVRRSNARAQRLYESFGFTAVGMRRAYYPAAAGQREDALVMNRRVSP